MAAVQHKEVNPPISGTHEDSSLYTTKHPLVTSKKLMAAGLPVAIGFKVNDGGYSIQEFTPD